MAKGKLLNEISITVDEMIEKQYEEAYNKGLEDAWKLARKISDIPTTQERADIFGFVRCGITVGDILRNMDYQEALAKLEAYEKEQEEIKVGDVVTTINGECGYIVTNVQLPNTLHCINSRNGYTLQMKISGVKKTGKHIDLADLFKQIGGGE